MAYVFDDATTLSRREIWSGSVGKFGEDEIALPDGRRFTLGLLKHPGASAVVPLLEDGRVLLLRQYRYAVRQTLWEVPAGKLDPGESPETGALRELEEETGYTAESLVSLGAIYVTPGYSDEVIHLWLARGLREGQRAHAPDESIHCTELPFDRALRMAEEGEIADAKTVISLLRARAVVGRT